MRARGEGTIHKEDRPNRKTKWRGEKTIVLPNGRKRRIVVRAVNRDDVVPKLRKRELEVLAANPDAERMTVSEYLDEWLAFKKPTVKPRTHDEYATTLRKVRKAIGDVRLARVRPTDVQAILTAESQDGRRATAANIRRYLKQAFRHAEKWGLIAASPVRNIDPVRVPQTKRSVLQVAQIERLLETARSKTPTYYALMHTAVFTGLRVGELVALPWANVAEDRIRVTQTASKHKPGTVEPPKTRASYRVVPINRTTYDVIRDRRRGGEWAFPNRHGGMLSLRNTQRAFSDVRDELELGHVRFHDLRRTAATLWALHGATPKMIQMLLGHQSPHLALAIYTDVMDDQLGGAALDPGRVLSGGRNGGNALGRRGNLPELVDGPSGKDIAST